MADSLILGNVPDPDLTIPLVDDSDWTSIFELSANWPLGTTLTVELTDLAITWTATIAGKTATFHETKTTTDPIPDGTPALLRYVNGTDNQVWAHGKVVRCDG